MKPMEAGTRTRFLRHTELLCEQRDAAAVTFDLALGAGADAGAVSWAVTL